jgi:RNA polymerase sigma-70 factor, ECF subfamily
MLSSERHAIVIDSGHLVQSWGIKVLPPGVLFGARLCAPRAERVVVRPRQSSLFEQRAGARAHVMPMVFGRRPPSRSDSATHGEPADEFAREALSYVDSLYGTALRLTRRPADADDLVQDTYLKAFRAADQFERGTNLKAWLFTILHNTFRNMRRHDVRSPIDVDSETVERAADVVAEGQTPEQLLTRATLDADLQEALDALPEAFRQAVWLRDVEEFSYAEIAKIVGVPIGTVMSRISRGRRMLYERLAGTKAGA